MRLFPPAINQALDAELSLRYALPVWSKERLGEHDLGFRPRRIQKQMFALLRKHRHAVIVLHRRAGKTRGLLQWMLNEALTNDFKTPHGTRRPSDAPPHYVYAAPTEKMAIAIAWNYLQHIGGQIRGCLVSKKSHKITLPNTATIEIVGAQNPDNLRGRYVDAVVLDEYAYMNGDLYEGVLLPQLLDYNGKVVMCSTPAGRNDFYRRFIKAKKGEGPINPNTGVQMWGAALVNVEESGIFDQGQIAQLRGEVTDEVFQREMMCNFDAPIAGAIYGATINKMRLDGRMSKVPYNPQTKVLCFWDIGVRDDTAIWFCQITPGGALHFIDHASSNGKSLAEWVKLLDKKPYNYELDVLPHDARQRDKVTAESYQYALSKYNRKTYVLPKASLQGGIENVRKILPLCYFDEKCEQGVDALSLYQRKYNAELQRFERQPLHDWTSHSADAFRYAAEYLVLRLRLKDPISKMRDVSSKRDIERLLRGRPDKPMRAMSVR